MKVQAALLLVLIFISGCVKTEKTITSHEGDLIIDGNQTLTIENKIFQINGNLILKDNSTLIVNNSEIIMMVKFFGEYRIEVAGNSKLIVENSVLERADRHNVLFMVRPGSEAIIKNTISGWDISDAGSILLENYDATSAANGIFFRSGDITAINSKFNIVSLQNIGESPNFTLKLNGLKRGFIKDLAIERKYGTLSLKNSEVDKWVVDVGEPASQTSTSVNISNSNLWGLWMWFHPGSNVTIKNLRPGFYEHWKMSKMGSFEGIAYDVELVNTSVEMFKLQIVGNATVENNSGIQVATRGNAYSHVKNSTIEVNLIMRGNEEVILEDSIVEDSLVQFIEDRSDLQYILGRGGVNKYLKLKNALIKTPFEIGANYTKISGSGKFLAHIDDINFVFGLVEREYLVEVKDNKGNPVTNFSLALLDSNGKNIWEGLTDENGITNFTIVFTKENYKNIWSLKGDGILLHINLITETPIVLVKS